MKYVFDLANERELLGNGKFSKYLPGKAVYKAWRDVRYRMLGEKRVVERERAETVTMER